MPLYKMNADNFEAISETSFSDLKLKERDDLQRLLRSQIEVLGDDLYVLSEEFGDWEESKRRIDLLAIDRQANLVVIELKRTNDGGHMELQAIRYAAMVSTLTFENAVQIHRDFLVGQDRSTEDAKELILGFLGWNDPEEENFADDVRIILVAQDFGKELTSAVLWLRDRDINIQCIRLCPYNDAGNKLIDVQVIIPLPEVAEYQIKLKEKEKVGRKVRIERHDLRLLFWEGLVNVARQKNTKHGNIKPGVYSWIGVSSGIRGLNFNHVIGQDYAISELYIDRGDSEENKRIFDHFNNHKNEIENTFGDKISWERLDSKRASRIKWIGQRGGYRNPEPEWPEIQNEMVEKMIKLESALKPFWDSLKLSK